MHGCMRTQWSLIVEGHVGFAASVVGALDLIQIQIDRSERAIRSFAIGNAMAARSSTDVEECLGLSWPLAERRPGADRAGAIRVS